ncbi:hypothetical protein HK107_14850 [Parvularcula sp. ZS-1/3]|uniref:DUF4402 domain-containing protein n=1 Tax=Parvularcula mediterranea TaxID=2732508 RepID=A0A7Y3RP06_9PROT|nr:hypothetical protein [Parvularcula mediterranea]
MSVAAAQQTVTFTANVGGTCTVIADTDGTLGPSADLTILSSTEAGGTRGRATVTTTGSGFNVTVAPPANFTTGPVDADTNTSFATSYDASGVTVAVGVPGPTPSPLGLGLTFLDVDATATKSAGTFSAGNYTLDTIVTCAP